MGAVRIGLVGGGFPALRGALDTALTDAGWSGVEIVDVVGDDPAAVDVLCPQGALVDGALMDATGARLVQQFGVGLSGVDLDAARERGIPVDNVPGAASGNATAVAELAMLHLLALLRRFEQARANVAGRRVGEPMGTTLAGRTVAVLGVGDIGRAVVRALRGFGAVPVGVGRRPWGDDPATAELLDAEHYATDLVAAARRCDDVVVCCPLTDATRGLVGAAALAALRPGGHVVNVARGGVVDRDALLAALRSGHLAGAGLDVTWAEPIDPDDELLAERVAVTPHVGGVTTEAYAGMAAGFVAAVDRHLGRHLAG